MTKPMRDREYTIVTGGGVERRTELHELRTEDGVAISVSRLKHDEPRAAVVMGHGLTTSSDMFVMPEHKNLASYLHDRKYDVWVADNRLSNHYRYNAERDYTLDHAALYDWPQIVRHVRKHIGDRPLYVIVHCLGSASFSASLYGLQLQAPEERVDGVISNSISLNPRVHWWSFIKLMVSPFLVERVLRLPYLDPTWEDSDSLNKRWRGRLLTKMANRQHLECDEPACNLLSFMWGSGFPALYQHDNMDPATHGRLAELFGPVGMTYFRHVRAGLLRNKTLVRYAKGKPFESRLPERYIDNVREISVPTLLVQGEHNHVFPLSNRVTYDRARAAGATHIHYHEFPHYGHQDVFMGRNCGRDTFPLFAKFLEEHGA